MYLQKVYDLESVILCLIIDVTTQVQYTKVFTCSNIYYLFQVLLSDSFPTKTMISVFWIRIFVPNLYAYIPVYKLSL